MIYLSLQITNSLNFNYINLYNKIILSHFILIILGYLLTLQNNYIISKYKYYINLNCILSSIILIII